MTKSLFLILCLLFGLAAQSAHAEDKLVARIKTLENDVEIVRGNTTVKAALNAPIYQGDTIKTGKNSTIGITLTDNTMMAIGYDSTLTLDEFLYAPAHDELKLVASITKGTLLYVSGIIAKLKHEAVTIKTPTATLGVNGTRLSVKVA